MSLFFCNSKQLDRASIVAPKTSGVALEPHIRGAHLCPPYITLITHLNILQETRLRLEITQQNLHCRMCRCRDVASSLFERNSFSSHVAPKDTALAQVDWNQCDPQRISTSKLLFRTVLTICWMPSQLTAHLDRLPNWT